MWGINDRSVDRLVCSGRRNLEVIASGRTFSDGCQQSRLAYPNPQAHAKLPSPTSKFECADIAFTGRPSCTPFFVRSRLLCRRRQDKNPDVMTAKIFLELFRHATVRWLIA